MKTIGIGELKEHLSEALHEVQVGESIEITGRVKVIARIVPVIPQPLDRESIRTWLADTDRLAAETGVHWPQGVSAQDAADDVRREL